MAGALLVGASCSPTARPTCLQSLHRDVAATVLPGTAVRTVITTSELEHRTRNGPRIRTAVERIATSSGMTQVTVAAGA